MQPSDFGSRSLCHREPSYPNHASGEKLKWEQCAKTTAGHKHHSSRRSMTASKIHIPGALWQVQPYRVLWVLFQVLFLRSFRSLGASDPDAISRPSSPAWLPSPSLPCLPITHPSLFFRGPAPLLANAETNLQCMVGAGECTGRSSTAFFPLIILLPLLVLPHSPSNSPGWAGKRSGQTLSNQASSHSLPMEESSWASWHKQLPYCWVQP